MRLSIDPHCPANAPFAALTLNGFVRASSHLIRPQCGKQGARSPGLRRKAAGPPGKTSRLQKGVRNGHQADLH
jgi:hypothetical protein